MNPGPDAAAVAARPFSVTAGRSGVAIFWGLIWLKFPFAPRVNEGSEMVVAGWSGTAGRLVFSMAARFFIFSGAGAVGAGEPFRAGSVWGAKAFIPGVFHILGNCQAPSRWHHRKSACPAPMTNDLHVFQSSCLLVIRSAGREVRRRRARSHPPRHRRWFGETSSS